MKVVFDVSTFGGLRYWNLPLTGIYRVVENIASGLMEAQGCELLFSASKSLDLWRETQLYCASHQSFNKINLISPKPKAAYELFQKLRDELSSFGVFKELSILFKSKSLMKRLALKAIAAGAKPIRRKDLLDKDIFHSPYFAFPSQSRGIKNLKRFLTIHDIYPIIHPQFYQFSTKSFVRDTLKGIMPNDWIICPAESTKKDICDVLKYDPSRIFVINLAADKKMFYPCSDEEKIISIKNKYNIPRGQYVLGVYASNPRKNIPHLIQSFVQLVKQEKIKGLCLVLMGTYDNAALKMCHDLIKEEEIRRRIIFTGYIANEDLACLYSGALVFVYVSLYEGFGLPVLEAMQCKTPVIASNTSSLPEVVGDAGRLIAPDDSDMLSQSILEIYKNSVFTKELSTKGFERAKTFSWPRCIRETIDAYTVAMQE
jgi:glycosyltransferase involved in cell wall biosynthesis